MYDETQLKILRNYLSEYFSNFLFTIFEKYSQKQKKKKKMLELQYKKNNAPLEYGKIIKKINGYNLKFDLSKKVREV